MTRVTLIIPCYNEAKRLDTGAFEAALDAIPSLRLLFVNDGSEDETGAVLEELSGRIGSGSCSVLSLARNSGKAEAVRQGVLTALGPNRVTDLLAVGYWDADLATPLEDAERFASVLQRNPEVQAVIGSRIRLMGRQVQRRALRHYSGRAFATLASLTLGFPVYDTQCGAKLFRATEETRRAFETPFTTAWAFDVELLARLASRYGRDMGSRGIVVEYPLESWTDVAGSAVKLADLPRMITDLARIRRRYR